MTNFYEEIDYTTYENGFEAWFVRATEEFTSLSDEEYEELQVRLAKKAYANIDTGLTRIENYYLISEALGASEANEYLRRT